MIGSWLLPEGVDRIVLPLLVGKALLAFADGYVAILLPAYLLALGFSTLDVGILSTATLLGSALATLAVGAWGHRFHHRHLLLGECRRAHARYWTIFRLFLGVLAVAGSGLRENTESEFRGRECVPAA